METFKIIIKNTGQEIETEKKIASKDILKTITDKLEYPCYLVKVNNAYRSLSHLLWHDCEIEFLDIRNQAAWQVYQNSLILLFNKAVKDILGKGTSINVKNSLNKGLYARISAKLNEEKLKKIQSKMQELVNADLPIVKHHFTKEKAIELAKQLGQHEIIDLLESLEDIDDVQIYSLQGEMVFLYSQTVPSTGYLKWFDLRLYKKGVILTFPHPENPLALPDKTEQENLYQAFKDASNWGRLLNVEYITDVNNRIENGTVKDLVLLQEALHEKKIAEIAEEIKRKGKRLVLICGPSSSGKTTFANRLCIQLKVAGLKPMYMGTDDYFRDEEDKPLDENGKPDLESINAVDVPLFIKDLKSLLAGDPVDMPVFDFASNRKVFGLKPVKLDGDEIIVIEGIHALNGLLTEGIDEGKKYKIYISPFTPVAIDKHNRISTTDARMLRRLVRDNKFRGRSPQKVLDEWINVRKSENVNIFPFHVEADVFFNTNCIYELPVLKKYAQPLLEKVTRDEPQYAEAQRMLSFLNFISAIEDDSMIPNNSIVREFIGGSVIV